MEILLSTGSLTPRSFADAAAIARSAGADGLEVLLNGRLLAAGPEIAMRVANEHNVPIRTVHPPIRLLGAAAHVRDDLLAAAEYARAIPGCRVLVMHAVGGTGLHTERGRDFLRTVSDVSDILGKSGVRLAIENRGALHPRPKMDFLDKLPNLFRVCEEWNLGIVFDTSHAASYGINIVSALDVILPRLVNIHFSDRREDPPPLASGLLNSLTREHQVPGAGALPLAAMLERLRAKRYDGALTLELSPVALASWHMGRATERVTRAVAFAREYLAGQASGRTNRTARPRRAPLSAENDT